jgi:hypothetical protein
MYGYGRRMESRDKVGAEVWVLLALDVPASIFTVWLTVTLARGGLLGQLLQEWLS